jgi:hypothetical protein
MATEKKKPDKKTWTDPKQAPIGTGMAKQAKEAIVGRRRSLDDMVDEAVSGKKKKTSR